MTTPRDPKISAHQFERDVRGALDRGRAFESGASVFQSEELREQLKKPADVATEVQVTAVHGYCSSEAAGLEPALCSLEKVIAGKSRLATLATQCIVEQINPGHEEFILRSQSEEGLGLARGLWTAIFSPIQSEIKERRIQSAEALLSEAVDNIDSPSKCEEIIKTVVPEESRPILPK